MTVRVSLKKGVREDPGWQAWVLARPGLATWASTERAVLARLPDKLAAHHDWLRAHGETPHTRRAPFRVVERVEGDEVLFGSDLKSASVREIRRAATLLRWTRRDLLGVLGARPAPVLDWDPPYAAYRPWASWRTMREVVAHIARTETRYYLPWIGYRPRTELPGEDDLQGLLRRTRSATLRFLERLEASNDRLRLTSDRGESWTVRKVLRRLVWHELLHTKSIRRILAAHEALRRQHG